jgi:hypothetical protein
VKTAEIAKNSRDRDDSWKNHALARHSHQWMDGCNLAMTRRIAEKIQQKPGLMKIARDNLKRWKKIHRPWPPALREWEEILAQNPTERVLEILTQDNDEGQRLRQSDPFVGILTEKERTWFLENYEPA